MSMDTLADSLDPDPAVTEATRPLSEPSQRRLHMPTSAMYTAKVTARPVNAMPRLLKSQRRAVGVIYPAKLIRKDNGKGKALPLREERENQAQHALDASQSERKASKAHRARQVQASEATTFEDIMKDFDKLQLVDVVDALTLELEGHKISES